MRASRALGQSGGFSIVLAAIMLLGAVDAVSAAAAGPTPSDASSCNPQPVRGMFDGSALSAHEIFMEGGDFGLGCMEPVTMTLTDGPWHASITGTSDNNGGFGFQGNVSDPIDSLPVGPSAVIVTLTSSEATIQDGFGIDYEPAGRRPTTLKATPVIATINPLHLYLLRLTATLTSSGTPVGGEPINFTAGNNALCAAKTGANGIASCQVLVPLTRLLNLLSAGSKYTATFTGDATYVSSTASAGLIG